MTVLLALLAKVPITLWLFLILVLGALGVYEYQRHEIASLTVALETEKAGRAEDQAAETAAAASAEKANQAETARRAAAQLELTNEAQRLSNLERAAVGRAAAADASLRSAFRAAAAARSCAVPSDPGPATGGDPAAAAGDVQSDVFGRIDDAADVLARALGASHAAGLICQRAYQSLKVKALKTFADPMGHALP